MVANDKYILDLLSGNNFTFFIPPYQRNYEWTKEQCSIFLEDIKKTAEKNSEYVMSEHFFGTITYHQVQNVFGQPAKLVLIDGQQRVTTIMLFLVAMRDVVEDENWRFTINNQYLRNNNMIDDAVFKIKLKQVDADWESYKNIVLSLPTTQSEQDSSIYKNYNYFKTELLRLKQARTDIKALVEKGLSRFSVVTIELNPEKNAWENPQEIFESMNSLGKPLSLADLVRNYLMLGKSPEEQEEMYRKYWLPMEKSMTGQISNYIRDYMQALDGKTYPQASEKNYKLLYRSFKEMFDGKDTIDTIRDLYNLSCVYSYLVSPQKTGEKDIDAELRDINYLQITTSYSFLMMLLHEWKEGNFSKEDIVDILCVFKTYCIRKRILGTNKSENKVYPTYVRYIDELKEAADKKTKMFELLANQESSQRLPNDIETSRAMHVMDFYNFKYCRFIFQLVEEKITKCRPDEGMNDTRLQNEHIMPQTLNKEWKETVDETKHQELVNTIGNLTLIRHNQELGNKSFEKKKKVYENNAGLQIAKTKITNCEKWSEKEIRERADWLIDFILKEVLPIPDEMRRKNNFTENGKGKLFSFSEHGLIGEEISFMNNPFVVAKVVGEREVEFEGKVSKLTPLTRKLFEREGKGNASRAYRGSQYWYYNGKKLADL